MMMIQNMATRRAERRRVIPTAEDEGAEEVVYLMEESEVTARQVLRVA